MHFLAAYGGQSIVNPNSGKTDSLFALVCIFLIYLLWSKGMSKKGKPIPGTILALVISGLILVYALVFGNVIFLHIAISLCAITVYRMIRFSKVSQNTNALISYYPLYWTAFTTIYVIYSTALLIAIEFLLYENYEFRSNGMLLYTLVCIFSLIISFVITSLYFLPYLTAQRQNHIKLRTIYLLNIFTGWTVIGWITIMIWLCTPSRTKIRRHNNQQEANEKLKYKQLLDELLDSGAISQEEYQRRIGELLNQ